MCTHQAHTRRQFLKQSGSAVLAANMFPAGAESSPASPGTPFSTNHRPRQISPHLFWLEDTCNVYLVKDGNQGLLIDFGSGKMLELAGELDIILRKLAGRQK